MRVQGSTVLAVLLSAGVVDAQTVRSSGPGSWGPATRLIEELRIGVVEGDEAYTFGAVSDVAVGRNGTIIVAEMRPVRVRMYSAEGRFMRAIGGPGQGPGEYGQVNGLKVLKDGTIALWDSQNGRISLYEPNGEYRKSVNFRTGFFTTDMFQVDRSGNFYVKALGARQTSGTFVLNAPLIWIKLNTSGAVVDTIPIPQGETSSVQTYGGPGNARVDALLSTLSPFGYFVMADPMRYAIDVQRPRQPLRIERQHTPVPLFRAERDEWQAWADYMSRQPIGVSVVRAPDGTRQAVRGPTVKYAVPRTKPAIRSLSVDDEGRIWVERYVEARRVPPAAPQKSAVTAEERPPITWREPPTFDVFEMDGKFLGTVIAPDKTTFHATRGKTIWATQRGEFDEIYIVRFRIE